MSKSGVIYQFKCPQVDCPEEYIGELGGTFGDRLREHLRVQFPIHQHSQTTGHPVELQCYPIVHREAQGITRTIKEAMYILVNDPSLNRNLRKYKLPTYGMRYYWTLLHCGSINSESPPHSVHNWPNPSLPHTTYGGHTIFSPFGKYGSLPLSLQKGMLYPFSTPNIIFKWHHL